MQRLRPWNWYSLGGQKSKNLQIIFLNQVIVYAQYLAGSYIKTEQLPSFYPCHVRSQAVNTLSSKTKLTLEENVLRQGRKQHTKPLVSICLKKKKKSFNIKQGPIRKSYIKQSKTVCHTILLLRKLCWCSAVTKQGNDLSHLKKKK